MSDTAWDRLEWAAEAVVETADLYAWRHDGGDPLDNALDQLAVAVAEVKAERAGTYGDPL